ncbi:nucleotide sugar dehydrogenase [Methanogenium organophilum]|uniref:UDP-N-acetyl-D-mannosamine dehydrogenase n=1 Tax=Methanogenium organophilum TaxID=2199 RepID=A0A9X9T9M1_METOG|nr:nucleotide sugar dehydrogenase [Methanogenium organophilum]WAI02546.1 nucleotide sugar dehydrogenase [Methanogenium organophilum]
MSENLQRLFRERGPVKTIGVIGMGYVGIPAAVLFADAPEFDFVYGFQRDSKNSGYKIGMLNAGESPLKGEEPGLEDLIWKVVREQKFVCTADFSKIRECDAVTLAIQTPFADPKDLIPDFTPLTDGIRNVGHYLTPGTLVVLESTITPGTTMGMAREILEEESGLVAGVDFGLAHAPERVMVGRLLQNIREYDRIVGGIDDVCTTRAGELYGPILTKGELILMSATAAEVTKTAENTFRDLQIAAVNELALYCEAMGINVYDVRTGVASLKGEGVTRAILWPGAGVGGHCLTKDTYHLERGVQVVAAEPPDYPEGRESLFLLARGINDFMPSHMLKLTKDALARVGKDILGAKIAVLGWAFLNNSGDARNTPSEMYRDLCLGEGADVVVHDPYVLTYPGVPILQDADAVLDGADVVAILTGHSQYRELDPVRCCGMTGQAYPVVVDGRNIADPDAWIAAGFVYKGIGRGDKNGHPLV